MLPNKILAFGLGAENSAILLHFRSHFLRFSYIELLDKIPQTLASEKKTNLVLPLATMAS